MEIEEIVVRTDQIPLVAEWLRRYRYSMLVTGTMGPSLEHSGIIFMRHMEPAQIAAWGDTLRYDPRMHMVWAMHRA